MQVQFVKDDFGFIWITSIDDIWCRVESKIPTNTDEIFTQFLKDEESELVRKDQLEKLKTLKSFKTMKEAERERRHNLRKVQEAFGGIKTEEFQAKVKAASYEDGDPEGLKEVFKGLKKRQV